MKSGIKVTGEPNWNKVANTIKTATEDISENGAQEIYDAVRMRLNMVLQNPTGYYESRVQINTMSGGAEVTDGGVVYGPWLEGTSSRNGRTRFKGYQTFRKVMQDQQKKVLQSAENTIGKAVAKIR